MLSSLSRPLPLVWTPLVLVCLCGCSSGPERNSTAIDDSGSVTTSTGSTGVATSA